MSWLRKVVGIGAFGLLLTSQGCGGAASTPPTAPSVDTYTDVFTGTVLAGGVSKDENHFTVHQAGNITATITKLSPLSTITMGLGLGVYDASTSTCNLQLGDSFKLNVAFLANFPGSGELCVGVYDVGNILDSIDFEVTVVHT